MPPSSRVDQLQREIAADDIDAVVLFLTENVLLMTGFFVTVPSRGVVVVPRQGAGVLFVPTYDEERAAASWDGEVRTFRTLFDAKTREARQAPSAVKGLLGVTAAGIASLLSEVAARIGAQGGRIGYEGSFEQVAPASLAGEPNAVANPTRELIRSCFSARSLVDVTETLETIRAVKTRLELERIQRANEVAQFGLVAFRDAVRPGNTEAEIQAAVEAAITVEGTGYNGARVARGFATVKSGRDLLVDGWSYFTSRRRVVEKNDLVMVELGTMVDGYWADHTRTAVAGIATSVQRAAYSAVRTAIDAALAASRPGVAASDVDAAARSVCAGASINGVYPHHTGHGVGFRWHETRPHLLPGSEDAIRDGMVVAVEPGFYGEDVNGGIRQEDCAVITESGGVPLISLDFEFER